MADFSDTEIEQGQVGAASGVSFRLSHSTSGTGGAGGEILALNSGKVPRGGAWGKFEKRFDPWLNLKRRQAIAVEIEGDGGGEILAFRLESPKHISFGALADRYLTVDFVGRRGFLLLETESTRWSDYVWEDGKGVYNAYRETIDFGAIESFGVWCQNLPPNSQTKCHLEAVKAVPMIAATTTNLSFVVNGAAIRLPVKLTSGEWVDYEEPGGFSHFGASGEALDPVAPGGEMPRLAAGLTRFSCEPKEPNGGV